jgi:hypothetical protein
MRQRTEQVETIIGKGQLRLTNRYAQVDYDIRVFQEFDGDVPTIKSARGNVNLSNLDATFAMIGKQPMELELQDGRKAQILLTDTHGTIQVTGPIA